MEIEIGLKLNKKGADYSIVEIGDLRAEWLSKEPVKAEEKLKVKLVNMITLTHPPFKGAKEGARPGGELVLPATFNGKPITRIDNETAKGVWGGIDSEFYKKAGKFGLTKITIPEGITTICKQAFSNFMDTQFFSIPMSVKTIENYAFSGSDLPRTIIIANGVETIGEQAFFGNGLTEIVIPESVTFIGNNAFENCRKLEKITLPLNAKLGKKIFKDCFNDDLKITTSGKTESIKEWEKRIKEEEKKAKEATSEKSTQIKFKRKDDSFIASIDWCNGKTQITYEDEDDKEQNQTANDFAQKLFEEQAGWDKNAKEILAEFYDESYGEWRNIDKVKVSKTEFLEKMPLNLITVNSDGGFEFWFSNKKDNLIGGHSLILEGTMEDGFEGSCQMMG